MSNPADQHSTTEIPVFVNKGTDASGKPQVEPTDEKVEMLVNFTLVSKGLKALIAILEAEVSNDVKTVSLKYQDEGKTYLFGAHEVEANCGCGTCIKYAIIVTIDIDATKHAIVLKNFKTISLLGSAIQKVMASQ